MANYQAGYGHGDVFGIPFDFYTNATINGVVGKLVTGSTVTMQTGKLVVHVSGGALAALTVNLPLNPVDGADAEISNSVSGNAITSLTVNANTGDTIVGTAVTTAASGATIRYKYSLNGDISNGAGTRTWVRVA